MSAPWPLKIFILSASKCYGTQVFLYVTRILLSILNRMFATCLHAMHFSLYRQKCTSSSCRPYRVILVHLNVIALLCLWVLLIVCPSYCVKWHLQHVFGLRLQNHVFNKIESWARLAVLEELFKLGYRIIILLNSVRIKENMLWNLQCFRKK